MFRHSRSAAAQRRGAARVAKITSFGEVAKNPRISPNSAAARAKGLNPWFRSCIRTAEPSESSGSGIVASEKSMKTTHRILAKQTQVTYHCELELRTMFKHSLWKPLSLIQDAPFSKQAAASTKWVFPQVTFRGQLHVYLAFLNIGRITCL